MTLSSRSRRSAWKPGVPSARAITASPSMTNGDGRLRFSHCGIADRWKCTIFQSEPRLAITNVTRPGLLKGLPSSTPVEVFNPAMTTAVSDRTMTSDELMGAARGFRVRSAPSKYFRIAAGSVTTVWLPVLMNSASGAFSFTMASTSDAANAFVHSSTTASASSFGPAIATDENDARMQTTDRDARMSSPKKIARNPTAF